jgi:hypothetical protein
MYGIAVSINIINKILPLQIWVFAEQLMFAVIAPVQKIYRGSSSPRVCLLFSALKNNFWGHRFEDMFYVRVTVRR